MPQPIAYNTGSQTLGSLKLNGIEYAISSSIVSGSNGQRWFSSVNPGNGIVLVTNSFTQSYSTYQTSTPLFYTASALTATAITGAINGLPDRFGQVPFTDTSSALQYVAQSGKYFMMNYEYPTIVTDQLSTLLNYNFWGSYPTVGNTWYDVSGKNALGSLTNFTYDDSGIGLSTTSSTLVVQNNIPAISSSDLSEFSIEFTAKLKQAFDSISIITSPTSASYSEPTQSVAKYNNVVCTFSQSGNSLTQVAYLNGNEIINNTSTNPSFSFGTAYNIGVNTNNNSGTSKIGYIQTYNKVLTPAEILQNYYQAPIVTDGLIFAVDAGNIVSYESGSTTTYSLTGSLSGSLVNGVGYSSENGGGWVFDGVDDYINTSLQTLDRPCTFSIWINLNSLLGFQTFFGQDTSQSIPRGRFYFQKANETTEGIVTNKVNFSIVLSDGGIVPVNANDVISINKWYNYTAVLTTTSISLYENGILQNTVNDSNIFLPANTPITLNAGYYGNAIVDFVNGKSSTFQIYNRALSATEVSQNFQAQRTRFGI
jgi:hypothetical protein